MLQPPSPPVSPHTSGHRAASIHNGNPSIAAHAILTNVTENERVVHQLLMQQGSLAAILHQDLEHLAQADPEVALQLAIHGQATKAYWDVVVASLLWPDGNPERLVKEVQEVKIRLLDLVPGGGARSQQLRRAIEDALDEVYFVVARLCAYKHIPVNPHKFHTGLCTTASMLLP